jgi:hypothetical protein
MGQTVLLDTTGGTGRGFQGAEKNGGAAEAALVVKRKLAWNGSERRAEARGSAAMMLKVFRTWKGSSRVELNGLYTSMRPLSL